MDLCQLSDRNHINYRCIEYTEPEMFGRCYKRSARHLGFSGDSGYFSQLSSISDAPCWNTGLPKWKRKVNKEIKPWSVFSHPLCRDEFLSIMIRYSYCPAAAPWSKLLFLPCALPLWEQSVIVASHLVAAGSCIYDVTIGQQLFILK